MPNKYSNFEILFIKENYPKYGAKYCAKILNKNAPSICNKAAKMGIKQIGKEKHPSMQNINPE